MDVSLWDEMTNEEKSKQNSLMGKLGGLTSRRNKLLKEAGIYTEKIQRVRRELEGLEAEVKKRKDMRKNEP